MRKRSSDVFSKIATNANASFILTIMGIVIGVPSLISGATQISIITMFVVPYISMILLLVTYVKCKNHKNDIEEMGIDNINTVYKEMCNINSNFRESQSIVFNIYQNFAKEIQKNDVDANEVFKSFYKEIKRSMDKMFSVLTFDLKRQLEEIYRVKYDKKIVINVCIKQLSEVYVKGESTTKLNTFAIYRDNHAYNERREIGKIYRVEKNTVFDHCLKLDNDNPVFIENDISKAIAEGRYYCENEDEIVNKKIYNKTAAMPIIHSSQSEKLYFGYLCIDTNSEEIYELFDADDILNLMEAFSSTLALFYYQILSYFPIVFTHIFYSYEEDIKDEKSKGI